MLICNSVDELLEGIINGDEKPKPESFMPCLVFQKSSDQISSTTFSSARQRPGGKKITWAVTRKLFSGLFIRYVGFGGGQVSTKRIGTKASMYDFIYLLIPCTQHSTCLFGKEVTLGESLNLCISFSIIILTSEFASKINEIMYKKTSFES